MTAAVVLLAALVFGATHVASLPPAFDDLDAINFAMGVRDFDVARHQPHPPGYPMFVAAAKVSTAWLRAAGDASPELHGLAVWSAAGGALLLVMVFLFARSVSRNDAPALMAMTLTAAAPLVWFNALRPLSDTVGLAVAFGSMSLVLGVLRRTADLPPPTGRAALEGRLLLGAFLAGLAGGFRSQMVLLTMPLLAWLVLSPRLPLSRVARAFAMLAAVLGGLTWAIPLIVVSGGLDRYLQALGGQAGEDFAGVVMLWTHPTPRVAVQAALNTLMLPWASPVLAGVMVALAACGFAVCAFGNRRSAFVMAVAFGPYLVFHLLFQETVTTRYALPLVPAMAMLAAVVLAEARRPFAIGTFGLLAAASLALALPAGLAFGRSPSPIFAAFSEMDLLAARGASPVVGMHRRIWSESRRARQWSGSPPGRVLESPRDYEWLEMVRAWREGHDGETWFLADPRRTDLALIDAEHRRSREYRWPFDGRVYVGGARPDVLDWHIYRNPGWFLGRGWALTPEVAGITERDGWGPHRRPSIGWIRRRPGETVMVFGGRHLGADGEPAGAIRIALDGRDVSSLVVQPGPFLEFLRLPPGTLAGEGRYGELSVTAHAAVAGSAAPRIAIEQFNLQAREVVQFGFAEGWFEPEYDPRSARSWRWMSDDATLRIHHAGRDVAVRIAGESPRRYYREPPVLRLAAGAVVLGEYRPATDFTFEVRVPAAALEQSGGRVRLQSSAFFVPGDRDGSPDRRRLALRLYAVQVRGTGALRGR